MGLLLTAVLYWLITNQAGELMVLPWLAGLAFVVFTQVNGISVTLHKHLSKERPALMLPALVINLTGIACCCYLISIIWLN